jgi:hypothetical protein
MPIEKDNHSSIKFPLPEIKEAFMAKKVFSDEMFFRVKKTIQDIDWGPGSNSFYHTSMGRWESGISFDQDIEDAMLKIGKDLYDNQDLVKTYYYVVRYQKQNGNVPHLHKHMDQNGCEQTVDICIEKNGVDWGIEVDGVLFPEEENSAVCFYGQQQVHSRPEYPADATEEDYLTVLFLHFVRPEHWFAKILDSSHEEKMETFGRYATDGDVRYFLHTGEVSQPKLPEGQERCECHNYWGVPDTVKDILGEEEFYSRLKK